MERMMNSLKSIKFLCCYFLISLPLSVSGDVLKSTRANSKYDLTVIMSYRPSGWPYNTTFKIESARSTDKTLVDCSDICTIHTVYDKVGGQVSFRLSRLGRGKFPLDLLITEWNKQLPYTNTFDDYLGFPPCFTVKNGSVPTVHLGCADYTGISPPKPVTCKINNDISLAYGAVNSETLNGMIKTAVAQVSCTEKATVQVKAQLNGGGDIVTLRSDGSLKSQLKVNGINGATGSTVTVPGVSGTNVQFSSTLISNGNVAAGGFYGSAVAVVTII